MNLIKRFSPCTGISAEVTIIMVTARIIRCLFISRGAILKLFKPKWHCLRLDCHLIPSGFVVLSKHSLHCLSTCRFLGAHGWGYVLLAFEPLEFPFLDIHFMQVKTWCTQTDSAFCPESISVRLCAVQHTVHTPDVIAVQSTDTTSSSAGLINSDLALHQGHFQFVHC